MNTLHLSENDILLTTLFDWARAGWIRDLDAAFADQLARLAPEADGPCLLAAAMVSHLAGQGHLLLDLKTLTTQPRSLIAVQAQETMPELPTPDSLIAQYADTSWEEALRAWSARGGRRWPA